MLEGDFRTFATAPCQKTSFDVGFSKQIRQPGGSHVHHKALLCDRHVGGDGCCSRDCLIPRYIQQGCSADPAEELPDVSPARADRADVAARLQRGTPLGESDESGGCVAKDASVVCGSSVWSLH